MIFMGLLLASRAPHRCMETFLAISRTETRSTGPSGALEADVADTMATAAKRHDRVRRLAVEMPGFKVKQDPDRKIVVLTLNSL
jgi:hypothetical protein